MLSHMNLSSKHKITKILKLVLTSTNTNAILLLGGVHMHKELIIKLEEDLINKFEIALHLSNENKDDVVNKLIRSYISRAFAQAAAAYEQTNTPSAKEDGDYYGKAIHRIPKWAKKQSQINHKIIRAFFQLSQNGAVTYSALADYCNNNEEHPDVYVPTFASNFAQMKFDGDKSHGKVFEVNDKGIVTVWDVVLPTLTSCKKEFLQHSTDIGYLNANKQRNMGKTKAQGTDHMQYLYLMRCEHCDHEYFANGSDIFQKKCPKCQGGADTGR